MPDDLPKLGVFVDAKFFGFVSRYYQASSPHQRALAIGGLVDVVSLAVARRLGLKETACAVPEKHTFRGGAGHRLAFDAVWEREGFKIHATDPYSNKEKGVDVEFALTTMERVNSAGLDAVALITGDADFGPLLDRLNQRGIVSLIPSIHKTVERGNSLDTARLLLDAAVLTPSFDDLIEETLSSTWRGQTMLLAEGHAPVPPAADGRYRGEVGKWEPNGGYGFVNEEGTGRSWFLHATKLDPKDAATVRVGDKITFNGNPKNAPGRDYPEISSASLERGLSQGL